MGCAKKTLIKKEKEKEMEITDEQRAAIKEAENVFFEKHQHLPAAQFDLEWRNFNKYQIPKLLKNGEIKRRKK